MLSVGEIDGMKVQDDVLDRHCPLKHHTISSPLIHENTQGNLQEQIGAATYLLEPGHPALRVVGAAVAEVGIARNEVVIPGCWGENITGALPVGRLALLKDAGDIRCAVEIELVQRVVFHGGTH